LAFNALDRSDAEVLARMRDRDAAGFVRVPELPMRTLLRHEYPSIGLEGPDDLAAIHFV
jgi:hypothetical protein